MAAWNAWIEILYRIIAKAHLWVRLLPAAMGTVLLMALITGPSASAAPVTLNLKNADINALIASISEITGKNFIVDPRVKGRVTVISSKPMEEGEIYAVFQSILAVHGFAAIAVPGEGVIKIVPEAGAKQDAVPFLSQTAPGLEDQVVTEVIQVQNVSAAQIVPILRPLIPPQGHLAAYAPSNVLIISDRAANVERVARIVQRVDVASPDSIEIVPLRHASASEVVRLLTALEQGRARVEQGAPAASSSQLVADERTNSVLVSGDPATRLRLRTLLAHLDTPVEGTGNTEVVYLRYAKAVDLLPILQGLSQTLKKEERSTAGGGAGQPAQGQLQAVDLTDIQADEATNALVVTAQPDILRALRAVIAQLDVRRAQVLVEAVIADITSEKAAELGVQWVVDATNSGVAAATNFTTGTLTLGQVAGAIAGGAIPATALGTTAIGALGVGNLSGNNPWAALITAIAKDNNANILATPTLVTLDNEEAEIIVGQNVPFVTGSFITTGGTGSDNPFQTIERADVGLTLKIKPQINEGNAVKMELTQEVSSVISESETQGPTTRKRQIRTNVLVEDGQILVLGGLIQDELREDEQKVPGLGDIPIIGNLFRSRKSTKLKTNLMVFLHPVILRDAEAGTLYTNQKYSYMREQQISARREGVALMPSEQQPLLPTPEHVQQRHSLHPTVQQPYPITLPAPVAPRVTPSAAPPPAPAERSAPPTGTTQAGAGFNNK